jgi:hypothetical protein
MPEASWLENTPDIGTNGHVTLHCNVTLRTQRTRKLVVHLKWYIQVEIKQIEHREINTLPGKSRVL